MHIIDGSVTKSFSDKDTWFLALTCFLRKIYGSVLMDSRQLNE